jgi:shikimate dehydrogenase
MNLFGLIGFPLSHSFSKKYFTEKFAKENIQNCKYELFEIENINAFPELFQKYPELKGLNVTIPHKQAVIPFLDALDKSAERAGAVNVIKRMPDGTKTGFNSDYFGFKTSLEKQIQGFSITDALVLGTGGASKAVMIALEDLGINYTIVSRKAGLQTISYQDITKELMEKCHLIVNTTPLGMYPKTEACPDIPYQYITASHFLYDLVYNPEETTFMKKGKAAGANVKNGLEMLIGQAEKAWEIWNM